MPKSLKKAADEAREDRQAGNMTSRAPESADPSREMELVRRCIAHDRTAWEEFVSSYSDFIYSAIFASLSSGRRAFNREDADDIFADVFLSLVDRDFNLLRNFQWRCGFRTWIWAVTRRRVARFYRKKGVATVSMHAPAFSDDGGSAIDLPSDRPDQSPSNAIENEERRQLIESSIKDLNPRDRLCLTLYYFDGLNYREISEMLSLDVNHVGQIIFRAKKRLEKILGDRV